MGRRDSCAWSWGHAVGCDRVRKSSTRESRARQASEARGAGPLDLAITAAKDVRDAVTDSHLTYGGGGDGTPPAERRGGEEHHGVEKRAAERLRALSAARDGFDQRGFIPGSTVYRIWGSRLAGAVESDDLDHRDCAGEDPSGGGVREERPAQHEEGCAPSVYQLSRELGIDSISNGKVGPERNPELGGNGAKHGAGHVTTQQQRRCVGARSDAQAIE
eukprot:scaffold6091_cov112-Isochrysis_galbana.AAC.2